MKKLNAWVGLKLRQRRIEKGFKSQEALANALGLDKSRISRWENGHDRPTEKKEELYFLLDIDDSFFDPSNNSDKTTTPGDMSDEELERLISKVISKTEALKKGDKDSPQNSEEKLRQDLINRITSRLPRLKTNHLKGIESDISGLLDDMAKLKKSVNS